MNRAEKIAAARKATDDIDKCLVPALHRLERAASDGNGAAVYSDPQRVWNAMADMDAALKRAREIHCRTAWPTDADYED